MFGWILDHLPAWLVWGLGGLAVAAVFVVLRQLGFTLRQTLAAMAGVGAAFGLAGMYQKGRKAGIDAATERRKKADARAVKEAREIEDEVAARSPSENRERLKKWKKS